MPSSLRSRLVILKYSVLEKGTLRMWKSFLDRPTQPKQYVQPVSATDRIRYELDEQPSQSMQCWHPIRLFEPRQWEESVHSAQRTGTDDHIPVLTQSVAQPGHGHVQHGHGSDYNNMGLDRIPSVWRNTRTAAAKVDALSSSGVDEIEIPAFLRKQAD